MKNKLYNKIISFIGFDVYHPPLFSEVYDSFLALLSEENKSKIIAQLNDSSSTNFIDKVNSRAFVIYQNTKNKNKLNISNENYLAKGYVLFNNNKSKFAIEQYNGKIIGIFFRGNLDYYKIIKEGNYKFFFTDINHDLKI